MSETVSLSEQATMETQPKRMFYPRDYARAADFIRRSRKDKTQDQQSAANDILGYVVTTFVQDNPKFDIDKFTRATFLRIQTTKLADFDTWATSQGIATGPASAAEHYSQYYKAQQQTMWADSDDPDDYEPEEDESDDFPADEPES